MREIFGQVEKGTVLTLVPSTFFFYACGSVDAPLLNWTLLLCLFLQFIWSREEIRRAVRSHKKNVFYCLVLNEDLKT